MRLGRATEDDILVVKLRRDRHRRRWYRPLGQFGLHQRLLRQLTSRSWWSLLPWRPQGALATLFHQYVPRPPRAPKPAKVVKKRIRLNQLRGWHERHSLTCIPTGDICSTDRPVLLQFMLTIGD